MITLIKHLIYVHYDDLNKILYLTIKHLKTMKRDSRGSREQKEEDELAKKTYESFLKLLRMLLKQSEYLQI